MIYLSDSAAATTLDILANTRLSSIPYGGQLTIQAAALANQAANHMIVTIQLPDGSVPVDGQRVTRSSSGVEGELDSRTLDQWTFPATQGGHFTIDFTETGTSSITWRVVLRP